MGERKLTDEQKKFLEECEEEFKDRYSEKDNEYMKIKNMERKPPPIDPWYVNWHRRFNERGRRYYHRHRPYYRRR